MVETPHVLSTTREVIAALGGTKAVAELTGRKYSAAANWQIGDRQTFPSNTFLQISTALAKVGKTAPASLWGMVDA